MDSLEIYKYLKAFKNFLGVFPRDKLPKKLNANSCIVINTDVSSGPGEHWVCIYINKRDDVIYFDSFGQPPLFEEIERYLASLSSKGWFHNTICFQSIYQDTCGMYCIYFLSCMLRHNDFNYFISIFNNKTDYNDILAKILYKVQV